MPKPIRKAKTSKPNAKTAVSPSSVKTRRPRPVRMSSKQQTPSASKKSSGKPVKKRRGSKPKIKATTSKLKDGTVSQGLTLADNGWQHFHPSWFNGPKPNEHGVQLNPSWKTTKALLSKHTDDLLYCYTQHQIEDGHPHVRQTRSSPNWEGGLVTYATCKHQMRTWQSADDWLGTWICGLNPSNLDNTVLFIGQVGHVFDSNYSLRKYVKEHHPDVFKHKNADTNPRGDLYRPRKKVVPPNKRHDHRFFHEPPNHTRSVETYSKSPGTEGGPLPKWWRDLEYELHSKRPPVFILEPCLLFPVPSFALTDLKPGRATLKLSVGDLLANLRKTWGTALQDRLESTRVPRDA